MRQFAESIAGHRECCHAVQTILRLPRLGLKPSPQKLDGKPVPSRAPWAANERVTPAGECLEDLFCVGRIALVFGFDVAAIAQEPCTNIVRPLGFADDFGEAALSRALPQFHLKEAVLRGDKPFGEKEIVLILCVDMRDTPAVSYYADILAESLDLEVSVAQRKGCPGARVPISGSLCRLCGEWCYPKQ